MPARKAPSAAVLIVDDEAVVLDVLSTTLKRRDIKFKTATNGEDAAALLEKEPFGCLLTDKNLPGIDGIELIRRARKLQPYCACMVITGYASTESVIEAMRLGAVDYLEKPFPQMGIVVEKIEAAMRAQRAAFERNLLSDELHAMQTRLAAAEHDAFQQKTELEMFENVLELRIEEATARLKKRAEELERDSRSEAELLRSLEQKLSAVLGYVRQLAEDPELREARGAFREIERRLEETDELLKRD